jgi:DNA topoisomerase-2
MIITDSDIDGIHISCLIQNIFYSLFPTLLKRDPPFIISMQTPIVRIFRKNGDLLFYDEQEYYQYVRDHPDEKIDKKYYKGLASSTNKDIAETFGIKIVEFVNDDKTSSAMENIFNKKNADYRKEWMNRYDLNKSVLKWNGNTQEKIQVSISDYFDTELVKHSIGNCKRMIPNIMDGLKEGHRKVLYTCFKRKMKFTGKQVKVGQLAGAVAECTNYHHGEQNLYGTIISLATSYIGSNNIPLLTRDGQFGSRNAGGKDAGAARYIFTRLDMMTRLLFRPEDDVLLDYVVEDGDKIEPKFYVPILPTILINGAIGVATGWSTFIPNYNPLDLIALVKIWLEKNGQVFIKNENITFSEFPSIKPWYRSFTGEITYEKNTYITHGIIETDKDKHTRITELPIGFWTDDFKDKLDDLREEKEIDCYKNYSTPSKVDFIIIENEDGLKCSEKNLKLTSSLNINNMVLFNSDEIIKKYENIDIIVDEFCTTRYKYYCLRKKYIVGNLRTELSFMSNKKRFIEDVRDERILLFELDNGKRVSRKISDIIMQLEKMKYDKKMKNDEEDGDEEKTEHGYDYLLNIKFSTITRERIEKLQEDIDKITKELTEIENTCEKDMWLKDISDFEEEYPKFLKYLAHEDERQIKKQNIDLTKTKKVRSTRSKKKQIE